MTHSNGNWMNDDQRAAAKEGVNAMPVEVYEGLKPISEDWLKANGFRWDNTLNDVNRHWILWLGAAVASKDAYSAEDLGLELSAGFGDDAKWFCWIRADYCGRYTRFVHVRHLKTVGEVTALIAAMTGFPYSMHNSYYGNYYKPEHAARLKADYDKRHEVRLAKEWGKRVERETGKEEFGREKLHP